MIQSLIFSLGVLIVGFIVVVVSRTLGTFEDNEEKWKDEFWWRQAIYGPAGYRRAVGILLGVLLMVVGLISLVENLLLS